MARPSSPSRRALLKSSTGEDVAASSAGALRVGVSCCLDAGQLIRSGRDYLYLNRSYTRALSTLGAVPIVLGPDAPAAQCVQICDALVLSGGGDLPESFTDATGDWSSPGPSELSERVTWERELLSRFAEADKPVLGVCFGMQLINLHFGGTLLTNLKRSRPDALDHGGQLRAAHHPLRVASESSFLRGWSPPQRVSSAHGQAVAEVAPGFRVAAWAPDGVIEAIEGERVFGVEWHPESDDSSAAIYSRLLQACR